MKRRLNVLCVIIMLVLSYSVIESLYYMGVGVVMGAKAGIETVEGERNPNGSSKERNSSDAMMNIKGISVLPHLLSGKGDELFTDSVYNEKTGEFVPSVHGMMIIGLETPEGTGSKILSKLLIFLNMIVIVWAIVLFLKVILAINRSTIFSWQNVRRLRRLGMLLIIIFGCSLLSEFLTLHNLRKVFSLANYDLTFSEMVSITNLVLGISTLIVAEVFAIGLKMKEEQELTI